MNILTRTKQTTLTRGTDQITLIRWWNNSVVENILISTRVTLSLSLSFLRFFLLLQDFSQYPAVLLFSFIVLLVNGNYPVYFSWSIFVILITLSSIYPLREHPHSPPANHPPTLKHTHKYSGGDSVEKSPIIIALSIYNNQRNS